MLHCGCGGGNEKRRRRVERTRERDLRIVSDSATPINQSETAARGSGQGGREGVGLRDFASAPPLRPPIKLFDLNPLTRLLLKLLMSEVVQHFGEASQHTHICDTFDSQTQI